MFEIRLCENCQSEMKLKIVQKGPRKGQIDKKFEKKRFCSTACQNLWQKNITWENRIGIERADEIRKERSDQVLGDKNPSKNPETAKKISESLKEFLKNTSRDGKNNPFYGKNHSDDFKQKMSKIKSGQRSYDQNGYAKQRKNTPKKEQHPNWRGGVSYGDYCSKFDKKLKEQIKERDNYRCQICAKENVKLHIHHIDYDKQNSNETNLISLCNSCHSKTNFQREAWIIFFAPIMEKIYRKEKLNE